MKKRRNIRCKRVPLEISTEPNAKVFVAGTFNNWAPDHSQLRETKVKGFYRTTLALPRGRHEYKFVVNGQWNVDPKCQEWVPNGFGSLNSVITVDQAIQ